MTFLLRTGSQLLVNYGSRENTSIFFFNQNFDLNIFFFNLNSVVCFFKIQIKFLLQILNLIVFLLKDF